MADRNVCANEYACSDFNVIKSVKEILPYPTSQCDEDFKMINAFNKDHTPPSLNVSVTALQNDDFIEIVDDHGIAQFPANSHFSAAYQNEEIIQAVATDTISVTDISSPFEQLSDFRKRNSQKLMFSHLNVNSVSAKFIDLFQILSEGLTDILFLSETKLDNSFPNAQFAVDGFTCHRQDRNANGGGLMVYVKEALPHKIRNNIAVNSEGIECIVLQVKNNFSNVFIICVYKPPNVAISILNEALECMLNKCYLESSMVFVIGDLNVNFLCMPNGLSDLLDAFNLKQVIKQPTCFKSIENPTLLDVILTDKPRSLNGSINVSLGISDFHNYIGAATKLSRPSTKPKIIQYRSLKKFDEKLYLTDLESGPFHVSQIFDDVDDQLWFHNKLLTDIIDKNAPLKVKEISRCQLPYMNDKLRKAINVKAMLWRKYQKRKSQETWSNFKKQRNFVNKLKRTSMKLYFDEKCNSDVNKNRHFWKVIKPFITNNVKSGNDCITLCNDNSLISNPTDVSNVFNEFFTNISQDLCEPASVVTMSVNQVIDHYNDHPSISMIQDHVHVAERFDFTAVSPTSVFNKLKELQSNKACGYDNIPAQFLKLGAKALSLSLTPIINNSLISDKFPDCAKRAQVSPLFKKHDQLSKSNYRPVSVLTATSKVLESIMCEQLSDFIYQSLSPDLAAYRKKYSCNNVLAKCVEDWRCSIDNRKHVGCVLIDLSKAFDSLPHGLLVAKLHAYGLSLNSCAYIYNYLRERKQLVKLGNVRSDWLSLKTGVPQGSLTGPLLFNIFMNDFILNLRNVCDVYNYADDNTLSFSHHDTMVIKSTLESASSIALKWFKENYMKANASKFQAICFSKHDIKLDINIDGNAVKTEDTVKLLGVQLDSKLKFNEHVQSVCKKAAKQINALQRLSKFLDYSCKLKIYESFVVSNFIYCSVVYNTFNITQDKKIEKLNKRALQLVCNDYTSPYGKILKETGKDMLFLMRRVAIAEFVFKILHNMSPPLDSSFLERKYYNYEMRDCLKLTKFKFNTMRYGFRSLKYQGSSLWNSLPVYVKQCQTIQDFKHNLVVSRFLEQCECGSCIMCKKDLI